MSDFSYINVKKPDSRSKHWNKDIINNVEFINVLNLKSSILVFQE